MQAEPGRDRPAAVRLVMAAWLIPAKYAGLFAGRRGANPFCARRGRSDRERLPGTSTRAASGDHHPRGHPASTATASETPQPARGRRDLDELRNEKTLTVRGFDSRQVPLFIDGIPVYVPYDG